MAAGAIPDGSRGNSSERWQTWATPHSRGAIPDDSLGNFSVRWQPWATPQRDGRRGQLLSEMAAVGNSSQPWGNS